MEKNDQIGLARDFIKSALKAKKLLHIYPTNNIIYRNAIDEIFSIAEKYLSTYGDLVLRVRPAEMFIDSERVYQSSEKADNLALFFFKEAIRELAFKKGLSKSELEDFLKLIGTDFDRDETGADFTSSLWEKGLESIKITLDEIAYIEGDDLPGPGMGTGEGHGEEQITEAVPASKGEALKPGIFFLSAIESQLGSSEEGGGDEICLIDHREDGELMAAYNDALHKDDVSPVAAAELTPEERGFVLSETKKDSYESTGRLANILIEMLATSSDNSEAASIATSLEGLIIYALKENDIGSVLAALQGIMSMSSERHEGGTDVRVSAANVVVFCSSPAVMDQLGRILDSTKDISEESLMEYAQLLGAKAVGPLTSLLNHLQTISARRMVNNVLVHVGKANMGALVARLKDPAWYVVRNIIYVLWNIGDKNVADDIIAMSRHEHPRVRLEVVKALNRFKSMKALQTLREFLDDSDSMVRLSAITVIGTAGKENSGAGLFARDAVLAKMKDTSFAERDFMEKKSLCETLALLNDSETDEYMLRMLSKWSIFGSRKSNESRACAAYYLGLIGSSKSLSYLQKLRNASNPLLREHVVAALQRIQHE